MCTFSFAVASGAKCRISRTNRRSVNGRTPPLLALASKSEHGGGMAKGKVGKTVESLGDYLREQRVAAHLTLRQLAEQAGVSNPYLSQIEGGLRRPSAEVLQQIAKALRISADQLYQRAGIVHPQDGVGGS